MRLSELPDNLRNKIKRNYKGCWIWTGAKAVGRMGVEYGKCQYQGKTWRVHRLTLTLSGEVFHADEHVDHICYETLCCNPRHLRAVHWWDNLSNRRCKAAETMKKAGNPHRRP